MSAGGLVSAGGSLIVDVHLDLLYSQRGYPCY